MAHRPRFHKLIADSMGRSAVFGTQAVYDGAALPDIEEGEYEAGSAVAAAEPAPEGMLYGIRRRDDQEALRCLCGRPHT